MSFDRIAPHYRWLETVTAGSLLQKCRTQFIDRLADAKSILLLGEGPGRFLEQFVRVNPAAAITCVDASARMLDRAKASIDCSSKGKGAVRFVHADVFAWCQNSRFDALKPGAGRFDGVASHFFLDCFTGEQLGRIVPKVASITNPDAIWLISDFQVANAGWPRTRSRLILWSLYRLFRLATKLPAQHLTKPDLFLIESGFRLAGRRHYSHELLHSDLWIRDSPCPPEKARVPDTR